VYNSHKLLTPFIPSFIKTILKSKRGTKDMYLLLIRNNIESNGQKIFSLGKIYCFICNKMRLITSPRDDFEVSPKRKNCIVNGILTPFFFSLGLR
jgi:hypothetical protein